MATLQDNLAADFEDVERRYESSRSPTTPVAAATAAVAEPQDKMIKPQDKKLNVKLKKVLTKSGFWAMLEMFEVLFS